MVVPLTESVDRHGSPTPFGCMRCGTCLTTCLVMAIGLAGSNAIISKLFWKEEWVSPVVVGVVLDGSHELSPLSDIIVLLRTDSGLELKAITNESGRFFFSGIKRFEYVFPGDASYSSTIEIREPNWTPIQTFVSISTGDRSTSDPATMFFLKIVLVELTSAKEPKIEVFSCPWHYRKADRESKLPIHDDEWVLVLDAYAREE